MPNPFPQVSAYLSGIVSWVPAESAVADDYARQAVAAYPDLTHPDCDFGGAAGSRADLALVRIERGEIEGGADALAPVFELPADQRINGERVWSYSLPSNALSAVDARGRHRAQVRGPLWGVQRLRRQLLLNPRSSLSRSSLTTESEVLATLGCDTQLVYAD